MKIFAFIPQILVGLGGLFFPITTGGVLATMEPANSYKRFARALVVVLILGLPLHFLMQGKDPDYGVKFWMWHVQWDSLVTFLILSIFGVMAWRREMCEDVLMACPTFALKVAAPMLAIMNVCFFYEHFTGKQLSPLVVVAFPLVIVLFVALFSYLNQWDHAATLPLTASTAASPVADKPTGFNPALHLDDQRGLCFTWLPWVLSALANIHVPKLQIEFFRWLKFLHGPALDLAYREGPEPEPDNLEIAPDVDPIAFWRQVYIFAAGLEKPNDSLAGWFIGKGVVPRLCHTQAFLLNLTNQEFETLYRFQICQLVDELAYRHRVEAAVGAVGPDRTKVGPGETSRSDEGLLGYQGRRLPDGSVVVEAVRPNQPPRRITPRASRKVWIHSDHFDWGYAGHAPAQLALAIALDFHQNARMALLSYGPLLLCFIRGLPLDQWFIPVEDQPQPQRRGPSPRPRQLRSLNALWQACERSTLDHEVPATAANLPADPEHDLYALRPAAPDERALYEFVPPTLFNCLRGYRAAQP
jgi:hypothetical protein